MPSMVKDDSIGAALGALASGFTGPSPKTQAEAMFMREKILGAQTDRQKNLLEIQNLQNQQAAQSGLMGEFNKVLTPQAMGIAPTVEAPLPTPDFNGPMPAIPNPQLNGLDAKLSFARAAAKNAIMRGGGPGDALNAAYAALGQARVLAGGVPTDEATARQVEVQLSGKMGSAATPLTDAQRRVLDAEKVANEAQTKTVTQSATENTILGPAIGAALNIPKNEAGQYALPPTQTGPFTGNSIEAQSLRLIDNYNSKKRAGQPTTAQEDAQYAIAFNQLYGQKEEFRAGPNGGTIGIQVQPSVPQGVIMPGGAMPTQTNTTGAVPAVPPELVSAPVSAPPATNPVTPPVSGAAPVSAPAVAPVAPAASAAPTAPPSGAAPGVRTVVPGKTEYNPEHVKRSTTFLRMMDDSYSKMAKMLDSGFVPSVGGEVLGPMARPGGGSMGNQLQTSMMNVAQGAMYPKDQVYAVQAQNFLNAVLRDESGAAVPESEYPRYIAALIPAAGDQPEVVADKRQKMAVAIQARREGLTLQAIHQLVAPGQPLTMTMPDGTVQTIAPQGTTTQGAPAAAPAPAPNPGVTKRFTVDPKTGQVVRQQ